MKEGDLIKVLSDYQEYSYHGMGTLRGRVGFITIVNPLSGEVQVEIPGWEGGHSGAQADGSTSRWNIPRSHVQVISKEEYKKVSKLIKIHKPKVSICKKCSSKMKRKKKSWFCTKCLDSLGAVGSIKRDRANYSKQDSKRRGSIVAFDRYIGVEIEAESKTKIRKVSPLLDIPESVCIGTDPTLINGIEVRTPPRKKQVFETLIRRTCKVLQSAGYQYGAKAGLHVHIDCTQHYMDDEAEKLSNIFKTYYALESVLYYTLPFSRRSKPYSRFVSKHMSYFVPEQRIDAPDPWTSRRVDKFIKSFGGRDSFYPGSLRDHNTLEFRAHEGTVDDKEIIHWAALLLSIVEYGANKFDEDKVKQLFSHPPSSKEKREAMYQLLKLTPPLAEYVEERTHHNRKPIQEDFVTYSEQRDELGVQLPLKYRITSSLQTTLGF